MQGKGARGWTLLEVLAALSVVGLGVLLFTRVQHSSNRDIGENSRIMLAGKLIEQFLEDTRITIAKDTLHNWPPKNRSVAASAPSFISLSGKFYPAYSPKDGVPVKNVMRMDIVAAWTRPYPDSVKVTTYVSKRF
jgi:prepilin-type N-terminal cleavage/methylation domain-containing protein